MQSAGNVSIMMVLLCILCGPAQKRKIHVDLRCLLPLYDLPMQTGYKWLMLGKKTPSECEVWSPDDCNSIWEAVFKSHDQMENYAYKWGKYLDFMNVNLWLPYYGIIGCLSAASVRLCMSFLCRCWLEIHIIWIIIFLSEAINVKMLHW